MNFSSSQILLALNLFISADGHTCFRKTAEKLLKFESHVTALVVVTRSCVSVEEIGKSIPTLHLPLSRDALKSAMKSRFSGSYPFIIGKNPFTCKNV